MNLKFENLLLESEVSSTCIMLLLPDSLNFFQVQLRMALSLDLCTFAPSSSILPPKTVISSNVRKKAQVIIAFKGFRNYKW